MRQKFSDRIGITKPNEIIQLDNISKELRNLLWNIYNVYYFSEAKELKTYQPVDESYLDKLSINLWMYYFKNPIDKMPSRVDDFMASIRDYFFKTNWYDVYNFLEFCLIYAEETQVNKDEFIDFTNKILKQELSGYRIIGDCFTPITNEEQLNSINNSLIYSKENNLESVYSHITAAIHLLSSKDLKEIDKYRNTIKESISAVEALCNKINKTKADGLQGALKQLKTKIKIHGALEKGFINLYGYTSDANGIRHTIMEEPDLDMADAVYMLVTCSGFINYIIIKANKAGLI